MEKEQMQMMEGVWDQSFMLQSRADLVFWSNSVYKSLRVGGVWLRSL